MSEPAKRNPIAAPLFAFDRDARKALRPYREHPAAEALDWASQAGDQLQLRVLAGGVLALGLLRRDARLLRAALRMALAHEAATAAKSWLKHRVIRRRPRSAHRGEVRPRKGRDTAKEESSFPSGHAGGAFAVAGAAAGELPAIAAPAHAAAAAVALARLPRGAHYPTDIAAGAVLGLFAAGAVNGLWALAARASRR
ncbi:MAG: phosphatase PAP2 family protein [Cypionkella sp.]